MIESIFEIGLVAFAFLWVIAVAFAVLVSPFAFVFWLFS